MHAYLGPDTARLDWRKASTDNSINDYQARVGSTLLPRLGRLKTPICSVKDLESEISSMVTLLKEASLDTIPSLSCRVMKKTFHDDTLRSKCASSKTAWWDWVNAGRPRVGNLYQSMKNAKKDVKMHVKRCHAKDERRRIQKRDSQFKDKNVDRFKLPRKKVACNKLIVDGKPITDRSDLLNCWRSHFTELAKSTMGNDARLSLSHLEAKSHGYDDSTLDLPFTPEEVTAAVKKLKSGKCGGIDGLVPEHLKHGGAYTVEWLVWIFNSIITLEDLPPCLKCGVVTPVFKGKGRDPLIPSNYRGITVSSVIAKCLECAILSRLNPDLEENGHPHHSQTAFRKKISCANAIFSVQESTLRYMQDNERTNICLYDLEKAFDTIEYPVLLQQLFNCGINGSCWRLLKNWYTGCSSVVRLNGGLSASFEVHRGVKQGSVLSPTLFSLVIDSLLKNLDQTGRGLSILGLDICGSAHADDLRTTSCDVTSAEAQGNCVAAFCDAEHLKVNSSKTKALSFINNPSTSLTINIAGQLVASQPNALCLGVWLRDDLSPSKSVQENIAKARRAFFCFRLHWSFRRQVEPTH